MRKNNMEYHVLRPFHCMQTWDKEQGRVKVLSFYLSFHAQ